MQKNGIIFENRFGIEREMHVFQELLFSEEKEWVILMIRSKITLFNHNQVWFRGKVKWDQLSSAQRLSKWMLDQFVQLLVSENVFEFESAIRNTDSKVRGHLESMVEWIPSPNESSWLVQFDSLWIHNQSIVNNSRCDNLTQFGPILMIIRGEEEEVEEETYWSNQMFNKVMTTLQYEEL